MQGKCFCGGVVFQLDGNLPKLYQCHCSKCRRVSGSSANAAMIVAREQLSWLQGEQKIKKFADSSGFKSHFCAVCGSPLPNLTRDDSAYWVPVGLLDDRGQLELGAHLYAGSRAAWDVIAEVGERYDEMPDADSLDSLLGLRKPVS